MYPTALLARPFSASDWSSLGALVGHHYRMNADIKSVLCAALAVSVF